MVLIHFCMLKYSKFKTLNIFILLLSCHSHFMYFKRICSSCDRQIVIMYYFTYKTVLNNNLQYKKIILLLNFNVVLCMAVFWLFTNLTWLDAGVLMYFNQQKLLHRYLKGYIQWCSKNVLSLLYGIIPRPSLFINFDFIIKLSWFKGVDLFQVEFCVLSLSSIILSLFLFWLIHSAVENSG